MNFAPEFDAPIDYMRRTRDYYLALGYDNPYRWAHYVDAPFTPLRKPLKDSIAGADHHGGALPARQGRPGTGRAYNAAGQVLHRLRRRHRGRPRHAHQPHRLRPQAHHGDGFRHLVSAAADARVRRARAASSWRRVSTVRRPTAARGSRSRPMRRRSWRAAAPRTSRRRARSSRTAPSVTRPSSLVARHLETQRHPDRASWAAPRTSSNGPACRASCSATSRSAIRRQAARARHAALHARPRAQGAGERDRPAHDGAIAAALDRRRRLEERLQQRRAHAGRGDRQAPRRVRQDQADWRWSSARRQAWHEFSAGGAPLQWRDLLLGSTKTRHFGEFTFAFSGAPQP